MVIVIRPDASPEQRAQIARALAAHGAGGAIHAVHVPLGDLLVLTGGGLAPQVCPRLEALPGVERVVPIDTPYQMVSRALQPAGTVIRVGDVRIGGPEPVIIAGPCSVESPECILEAAHAARDAGAHLLRGGAFKPRTSPYSFQGLGLAGIDALVSAGAAVGLPVVSEVMEPNLVEAVAERADVLQVGSRNMQNFPLLRAVGKARRPVLLKRGFAATIDEWLLAAEYIMLEGNPDIILCERGVRGFDPHTRNVLDLASVPLLAQLTHLPVVVDPSHATGRRELVVPLGVAAIAAGAHGLMVEMHPDPASAISDSAQTIDPAELRMLVERVRRVRDALDREPASAR